MSSAIDSNVVAASHQASGKVFGEGFEPAIAGRNASSSENGYAHQTIKLSSLAVDPIPRKKAGAQMDHASRVRGLDGVEFENIKKVYPVSMSKNISRKGAKKRRKDAEKSLHFFFAPLRPLCAFA